jgi:hypothetical protein
MTGVLHTRIQGVSYRTPTRSGKTDASGSFKYLPGETVVFAVGGIELGSAPGASNISLFTLAGLTPPTTELGLRRELARMRYTATPLSNAANRALLLLALDGDGDPANGIDVSSHEAALATAKLDFETRLFEFSGKLPGLAPGLNNNIPQSFPVKWLYRTLGVKMAGFVPTRSLGDEQNDGDTDLVRWSEVDASGEILSTFADQGADGTVDVTESYLRDSLGRVTRHRTIRDLNRDGDLDSDHLVVTTYDAHGNAAHVVETEDGDANGSIDSETVVDSAFDSHGGELKTTYKIDSDHDGNVDSIETHVFTRDAHSNLLKLVIEVDEDADGLANSRYVSDNGWDAANRQTYGSNTRDTDADGQVDNAWHWTETFGTSSRPLTHDEDYDADGDGVADQKSRTRYGYDGAGNITSVLSDYEDAWSKYHITGAGDYDRDHRPLTFTYSYDFDLDGTADSTDVQTYTYDDNGFPLTWEYVTHAFTTSPGSWSNIASYAYSAAGAETTSTSGTDFDGDGVLELATRNVIEYAPSNDAMSQIVDQYLQTL